VDRDVLAAWLEEGRSLESIGREVGKSASTVGYWVAKHGLVATGRGRHAARGAIPRAVLADLVAERRSTREIAERLDRSPATVRHWLKRYGLRLARSRGVTRGVDPGITRTAGECPTHGSAEFVRRGDGFWRCSRCRIEAVTARRRRIKEILVEEAGGACLLCGYDRSMAALQFHHIDPAQKSFDLGRVGSTRSLARARREAQKCALLCANCHAEVESGIAILR
jgi:transposase